jgi:hypothetical protein
MDEKLDVQKLYFSLLLIVHVVTLCYVQTLLAT